MKKLLICLLCCSCLLTGCSFQLDMDSSNKTSEEPKKTKKPANAITAVVTDKEQGIDGSIIKLSDFEIKLPKGYVYGTKEYKQGKSRRQMLQADTLSAAARIKVSDRGHDCNADQHKRNGRFFCRKAVLFFLKDNRNGKNNKSDKQGAYIINM